MFIQLGGASGDGVMQFATAADFPAVGKFNILYLAKDTGKLYYWDGEYKEASGVATGGIGVNPYLFPYSVDGTLPVIKVLHSAEEIFNAMSWAVPDGTEVVVDDSDWENTVLCRFNGMLVGIRGKLLFEQPLKRVHVCALCFVNDSEYYELRIEAFNNADYYALRKLSPEGTLQLFKYFNGSETILTSTSFSNGAGYKICSFYAGNVPYVKQAASLRSENQDTTSLEFSDIDITSFDAISFFVHSRVDENNLNVRIVPPLVIRGYKGEVLT